MKNSIFIFTVKRGAHAEAQQLASTNKEIVSLLPSSLHANVSKLFDSVKNVKCLLPPRHSTLNEFSVPHGEHVIRTKKKTY